MWISSKPTLHVWAIHTNGLVELRSGVETPRKKVCRWSSGKKKNLLKAVFFVGGRVIGYTTLTQWVKLFKCYVPIDTLVPLAPLDAEKVLNASWRRRHL